MSNQTKHTPGPWITDDRHVHPDNGRLAYPRGVEPETDVIVLVDTDQHDGGMLNETDKANLRLIAAAPQLLESLQQCLVVVRIQNGNLHPDTNEIQERARKALDLVDHGIPQPQPEAAPFKFDPDKNIDGENGYPNGERAARVSHILKAYKAGELDESGPVDSDTVQDLLTDLRHYCDRQGIDFDQCDQWAGRRHGEER
jgi:hypothetical protein